MMKVSVLNIESLLIFFIIRLQLAISLTCYFNECDVDEEGYTCTAEGPGSQELCPDDTATMTDFCVDTPMDTERRLLKDALCYGTNSTIDRIAGCGTEYGKFIGAEGTYICICFNDLCNNHFKNSYKSAAMIGESGEMTWGNELK